MQTANTSYRLQATVEQLGIVYCMAIVTMVIISMECHSPHTTETMTSPMVTVHKVGKEAGGTEHVCVHN